MADRVHEPQTPSAQGTTSELFPTHGGPSQPTHCRARARWHAAGQLASVNSQAVHCMLPVIVHAARWKFVPAQLPTQPKHERFCGCEPVPHVTLQGPEVSHGVHDLSEPALHVIVCVAAPAHEP